MRQHSVLQSSGDPEGRQKITVTDGDAQDPQGWVNSGYNQMVEQ